MATAITPLANITLSASASTVTFSSISQSYRDLYLVADISGGVVGNHLFCKMNGDSDTANYYFINLLGANSVLTDNGNNINFGYDGALNVSHFLDYSQTDKQKAVITRANDSSSRVDMRAFRWANTSAITSFVLSTSGSGFASGSTFALYGVSA